MEPGVIGLLILIVLIASTVGVLVKQRPDSWNLPLLRASGGGALLGEDLLGHEAPAGIRAEAAAAEPALPRGGPSLATGYCSSAE